MKYIPIFILLFMMLGCAPVRINPEIPGLARDVPSYVTTHENEVLIGVFREKSLLASAIHFWPTVDGRVVSGLLSGEYIEFHVPAKNLKVGAKCFGGWSKTWKSQEISISGEANGRYFFKVTPVLNNKQKCLSISLVPETSYFKDKENTPTVELGGYNVR